MVVLGDTIVRVEHNAPVFEAVFRDAPNEAYYQATTMFRRWFLRHRRDVVQQLPTPGLKRAFNKHGWASFRVKPFASAASEVELRRKTLNDPDPNLAKIEGRIREISPVVLAHEQGAVVRGKRGMLAVPIGKYARMTQARRREAGARSPADWNARHPDKQLFFIPKDAALGTARNRASIGDESTGVLAYEIGKTKSGRKQIEVVFELRKQISIPARLRIQATWQGLASYRDEKVAEHVQRVITAMGRQAANGGRRVG